MINELATDPTTTGYLSMIVVDSAPDRLLLSLIRPPTRLRLSKTQF